MPEVDVYTEDQLIHLLRKGNTIAFSQIFHTHRNKIYSFILRISGSPQQAEDIVQDIFLKIWTHRSDLPEIQNLESYLFRAGYNHYLNILKRKAKEKATIANVPNLTDINFTEQKVQYDEMQNFIRKAVEQLPTQQKLVYTLSREAGLNQQEISEKLHISVPTVKSHMTQALRSLRQTCKVLLPLNKTTVILMFTWLFLKFF